MTALEPRHAPKKLGELLKKIHFILLGLLLIPNLCLGLAAQITASGGNPVPTAYSSSDTQSRVMECTGNTLKILNQTDSILAFGFGEASRTPELDFSFVPPGPNSGHTVKPTGNMSPGVYLYIRALNGAETSGTIQVSCTTEN